MRRRHFKWLGARLGHLTAMTLSRNELLMKLDAAQNKAPVAWRLVEVDVDEKAGSFSYRLERDQLRQVRRREGRYLLRTNLTESDPAKLWNYYLQLVAVEKACQEASRTPAAVCHNLELTLPAQPPTRKSPQPRQPQRPSVVQTFEPGSSSFSHL